MHPSKRQIFYIFEVSKYGTAGSQIEFLFFDHPLNHFEPLKSNDPLHGITLESIVKHLVDHFGWEELGRIIPINCFRNDPSMKSSLTFLRKTPWARKRVEELYIDLKIK